MKQRKTVEDYLKTIYLLSKKREVHGAYIAEALGVSKPTVSIALKSLEKEGYLTRDERHAIRLTETGAGNRNGHLRTASDLPDAVGESGRRRENSGGGRLPNGTRREHGKLRGTQGADGKKEDKWP